MAILQLGLLYNQESNKGACYHHYFSVLDWIMKETRKDNRTGISWRLTTQLEDIDFADDICLT